MTVWMSQIGEHNVEKPAMEASLRIVSVESEPNPAKINWNC